MIKKRNLDPSLIQWIMTQTGLGPGIGELHWAAKPASSTSQFRTQLQRWGVEQNYKIHTTIAAAEAKMVAGRNDVLLVMPGEYQVKQAWTKDFTHMIGMCGPMSSGVKIQTFTSTDPYAFSNTGDHCQFINMRMENWGAGSTAVAGVKEQGERNRWIGCVIIGQIRSQQSQNANCCSLMFVTNVANAGRESLFEDCIIGDTGGETRTVSNGTILFGLTGGGACKDMIFRRCKILSRAEDNDPCAVKIVTSNCLDRMLLFDDCVFYNYSVNHGTLPDYVIRDACSTTHDIILKNTVHHGYDAWTNNATHCFTTGPAAHTNMGESTAADTS